MDSFSQPGSRWQSRDHCTCLILQKKPNCYWQASSLAEEPNLSCPMAKWPNIGQYCFWISCRYSLRWNLWLVRCYCLSDQVLVPLIISVRVKMFFCFFAEHLKSLSGVMVFLQETHKKCMARTKLQVGWIGQINQSNSDAKARRVAIPFIYSSLISDPTASILLRLVHWIGYQ